MIHKQKLFSVAAFTLGILFAMNAGIAEPENQSQHQLRESRNVQIGIWPNLLGASNLTLAYNLSGQITIGAFLSQNTFYPQTTIAGSEWSQELAFQTLRSEEPIYGLSLNYYFSEELPFYVLTTMGRGTLRLTTENMELYQPLSGGSFQSQTAQANTTSVITPEITNFIGAGLGMRWVFQNGLFAHLEVHHVYAPVSRIKVYVYSDDRGLVMPSVLSPFEILRKKAYLEQAYGSYAKKHNTYVILSFGYSL